jgi:hypothetical protein
MDTTVKLDAANRIVLSKAILDEAGILSGQTLTLTVKPGSIVIGPKQTETKVIKKGKLKLLTGSIPNVPIVEAVKWARR